MWYPFSSLMFKIASNHISFWLLQKGECANAELQKDQLYSLSGISFTVEYTIKIWGHLEDLLFIGLFNLFDILICANYILKILKKSFVVRPLCFWFHQRNLLNFPLHLKGHLKFQLVKLHITVSEHLKFLHTWRIKKRLLSKSTPFPLSFFVTSVKLLPRSLM